MEFPNHASIRRFGAEPTSGGANGPSSGLSSHCYVEFHVLVLFGLQTCRTFFLELPELLLCQAQITDHAGKNGLRYDLDQVSGLMLANASGFWLVLHHPRPTGHLVLVLSHIDEASLLHVLLCVASTVEIESFLAGALPHGLHPLPVPVAGFSVLPPFVRVIVDFHPPPGSKQGRYLLYIRGPLCHPTDQETVVDVVQRPGDQSVVCLGQRANVAFDVGDIGRGGIVRRDGRDVDAVHCGSRVESAQMACHDPRAAAHIEGVGGALEGSVNELAVHELGVTGGLVFETSMFDGAVDDWTLSVWTNGREAKAMRESTH